MTNFATLALYPSGQSSFGYSQVAYIRKDNAANNRCFVGLHTQDEPINAYLPATQACIAFATAIAYPAVVGQPTAPFAPLPTVDAPGFVYITQPMVAQIRVDVANVNRCYVDCGQTSLTTWHVDLSPSAARTLIEAQGNGQPGGGGGAQVAPLCLGMAAFAGVDGSIEPGSLTVWNGLDIVLASDPGYTPGSGQYAFPLSGADVPARVYVIVAPIVGPFVAVNSRVVAGNVVAQLIDVAGAPAEPSAFAVYILGVAP